MARHAEFQESLFHREIYITGVPGAVITGAVVTDGVVTDDVVTGGVVGGGGVRMIFGGQVEFLVLKVTSARCTQFES